MDERIPRPIRNAAKALIIKNGCMLAIELNDNGDIFYIMPGGGQNTEELLPEAVRRECAEEMGIEVQVGELAFVIEGVHGEDFHRVDLVFRCEYIRKLPGAVRCGDVNQTGVKWLSLQGLEAQPLYPSKLRREIIKLYNGQAYSIYLGNESMGDPEAT